MWELKLTRRLAGSSRLQCSSRHLAAGGAGTHITPPSFLQDPTTIKKTEQPSCKERLAAIRPQHSHCCSPSLPRLKAAALRRLPCRPFCTCSIQMSRKRQVRKPHLCPRCAQDNKSRHKALPEVITSPAFRYSGPDSITEDATRMAVSWSTDLTAGPSYQVANRVPRKGKPHLAHQNSSLTAHYNLQMT